MVKEIVENFTKWCAPLTDLHIFVKCLDLIKVGPTFLVFYNVKGLKIEY